MSNAAIVYAYCIIVICLSAYVNVRNCNPVAISHMEYLNEGRILRNRRKFLFSNSLGTLRAFETMYGSLAFILQQTLCSKNEVVIQP